MDKELAMKKAKKSAEVARELGVKLVSPKSLLSGVVPGPNVRLNPEGSGPPYARITSISLSRAIAEIRARDGEDS